jgi:hypothetical protein
MPRDETRPRRSKKNVLRPPRDVRDRDQIPVKTETRPRRCKKTSRERLETETTSLLKSKKKIDMMLSVCSSLQ